MPNPGIIDFHVHPLPLLEEEVLVEELAAAGVSKAVLLAVDVDPGILDDRGVQARIAFEMFNAGLWDISALDYIKTILKLGRTPNEHVAALVEKHPDIFVGLGSINVSFGADYVARMSRKIRMLGLKGVKILSTLQLFNPAEKRGELRALFDEWAKSHGLVMIHTGCDPGPWENPLFSESARPSNYRWLIEEYPDVQVVLAHAGSYSMRYPGIWLDEALEIAKNNDNVWLDTAAVTYLASIEKFAAKIREALGWERFLFGSDYPTVTGRSLKSMVDEVLDSKALTSREKEMLLIENPRELLKKL